MGQTSHGKIGHNHKGVRWNFAEKIDSQVSKIDTDLIEYVTNTYVKQALGFGNQADPAMTAIFAVAL